MSAIALNVAVVHDPVPSGRNFAAYDNDSYDPTDGDALNAYCRGRTEREAVDALLRVLRWEGPHTVDREGCEPDVPGASPAR